MKAIFSPLLKYWPLVLGLTVLVSLLAGWERARSHESRARLLFKLGDEFLQSGVGPDARTSGRILLAEAMNTDVQILTSHDRYEKVVEALGVDTFRPPDGADDGLGEGGESGADEFGVEEAIAALRESLNVKSVENSAVIHLTYEDADPERAKRVLGTLIDVYLRERERIFRPRDISVVASIRDEAEEAYLAARGAHERFLDGASVRDMESTLGILRDQLMTLGAEIRDTRRQLLAERRQLAAIESEIERQPARTEIYSEPRPNAALENARSRLVELRVEERQLLGKYTETSRPVRRVRSETAELQRIIRDEESASERAVRRTGNNPIRDALELQKTELSVSTAGAEARLEALGEQEAELGAELRALESRYVRAERLGTELSVAESRFRDIDGQYLEHRILADSEAAREANVRVIESPALPSAATGLPVRLRYALGAAIGFLAGWILALWIELLRATDKRMTGVPDRRRDLGVPERAAGLAYARPAPAALAAGEARRVEGTLPVLGEFGPVGGGHR